MLQTQKNSAISKTWHSYTNHFWFGPVQGYYRFLLQIHAKLVQEIGFWKISYANVLKSGLETLKIAQNDNISFFCGPVCSNKAQNIPGGYFYSF